MKLRGLEQRIVRNTLVTSRWMAVVAAAAAVAVIGAALHASEPVPLPDFEINRLDGTAIQSRSGLPSTGKWLMVYVQPNCKPCEKLLSLVKRDEHPEIAPRLVIVAGGIDGAATSRMRDKLTDLTDAQWYVDRSRKAWVPLKMTGAPMVFGVRDMTIEWSLSGVLPSDGQVKSILASWVAE